MKILLASSEVHPFSKTGGLADMVGALGKALAHAGHEAQIVTPLYRGVREKFPQMGRVDWKFDLPLGLKWEQGNLWSLEIERNLTVYFVEHPGFFDRPGIYFDNNVSYSDNAERFIFFSKCVTHLARYSPWNPDVIHIHDWQTALVPALVLHQRRAEGWGNPPPTCLTVHNLAYQGIFPPSAFASTNLPHDFFTVDGAEFYGQLNCLKAGIAFADAITTVSPRYAREITTEEFGCGLDDRLRQRRNRLFGILNGVDYEEWNTTGNKFLPHPYSITRLAGKAANKLALQKELGLPQSKGTPLFGTISRLAEQKGVDIALGALEEMLSADIQFVLLGSGSPSYERGYQELARRFPAQVAARVGYDEGLSHRIEAACDFFLMPSRFEPSGLNQMYSLRYGTIPIVRSTGGLDDSVVDFSQDSARANGIKFQEYSARALAKAIRKALAIYGQPALLRRYRQNAMKADFSWEQAVVEYLKAYAAAKNFSVGQAGQGLQNDARVQ
jgi:starch synthase